jgi:hypothetical protein
MPVHFMSFRACTGSWHSIFKYMSGLNIFVMRSLLYLIAVILIIGWLLGAFVWNAGSIIHILLVIAIISLLLGFIRRGTVD